MTNRINNTRIVPVDVQKPKPGPTEPANADIEIHPFQAEWLFATLHPMCRDIYRVCIYPVREEIGEQTG
jgi:hypothetical protein